MALTVLATLVNSHYTVPCPVFLELNQVICKAIVSAQITDAVNYSAYEILALLEADLVVMRNEVSMEGDVGIAVLLVSDLDMDTSY